MAASPRIEPCDSSGSRFIVVGKDHLHTDSGNRYRLVGRASSASALAALLSARGDVLQKP
jgi:hypothetical protein